MWVKVDDCFPEHMKVMTAARHLGANGYGRVLAVWLEALCYSNRHGTNGLITPIAARKLVSDRRPLDVLEVFALEDVRLMHKSVDGFRFHDIHDYQPTAEAARAKREKDRKRKSFRPDSARNPRGIPQEIDVESARIPARPVPDPVPESSTPEDQRRRRLLPFADVRRHLRKVAHLALDADPTLSESELAGQVKDAAAALRAEYSGRDVATVLDAVRAVRSA